MNPESYDFARTPAPSPKKKRWLPAAVVGAVTLAIGVGIGTTATNGQQAGADPAAAGTTVTVTTAPTAAPETVLSTIRAAAKTVDRTVLVTRKGAAHKVTVTSVKKVPTTVQVPVTVEVPKTVEVVRTVEVPVEVVQTVEVPVEVVQTVTVEQAMPQQLADVGQGGSGGGAAQPSGGSCPAEAPIKGNHSSSGDFIYHVPGGQYYDVTNPEECFASEGDAQNAGYRASKR